MDCESEYGPMGRVPESGAIFMSNRETKNECLKMGMFALPSGAANFVKQVKEGMFLFLFEYEKRQLFGVYQASTDGGINILPKTSSSSLKQYPAQVYFTPVWSCDPLSENEFRDVIRENYYSHKKFYFGLSEDQVHMLLQLFDSRKLKKELLPKQPRGDSEPLQDLRHKLNKKFDAEKLEGRDGSPDLSIRDQGGVPDQCEEQDNDYPYSVNVTNNRHGTNTFEQWGLHDYFSGSASNKRRMGDDDRHMPNVKDHLSVHHDVPAPHFGVEFRGDTLASDTRRKEDDTRYLTNLKDPPSVYHNVPALNFRGEHRGDTLDKVRRSSDPDEPLLSGKVQYEDEDTKYFPVSSDLKVAGNDMYTFVDRVVADSEHIGHQSSKSPHIRRETFSFGGEHRGDTLDKVRRSSDSDEPLLSGKVQYEDEDTKYFPVSSDLRVAGNDMYTFVERVVADSEHIGHQSSKSPHIRREPFSFGAKVPSNDNRPHKSSQFESEHSLGAFPYSRYSAGKFDVSTHGSQGVTKDEPYPVRYEKLRASNLDGPIWSSELHRNSGQAHMSSRRSFGDIQFTKHRLGDEPAMGSFHNSVISFGDGKSCQPKEDPVMYSEGPPPRKQSQLSESQHLVHTYPSYHESITKSIPCDSDVNFSHPDLSSSPRVLSSPSLLRSIPPYHDSGEPHVGNSSSLLYHPEENHSRKLYYSENKSELQYPSASANQDYYLGNTNNCFQNTEVALNRELGNTMDTNHRSLLFATSPSANTRFPDDVVCREEEKVRPHASSPHKHLSYNNFDSGRLSSSRACELNHSSSGQFPSANQSPAGLYPGEDLTNHDIEHYSSQGRVKDMHNDNAEHPLDVSGILKSNRRSVFARLSSGPEISSGEKSDAKGFFDADSIVDEVSDMLLQRKKSQLEKQEKCKMLAKLDEELDTYQMLKNDATVDELMAMLPQSKKSLAKKRTLARQPDEEGFVEQDHSKSSSAKLENDVIHTDGEDADEPLRETRLVEFKRRSETKKNLDGSIVKRSDKAVDKRTDVERTTGNKAVENKTAGEGTTDKPSKRRKLVRPVFVENDSVAEGHGSQT